jgi:2-polyprenyl-3-methyl-5-hydroxy-6-metoxy-1,4-benzoquinol methylase
MGLRRNSSQGLLPFGFRSGIYMTVVRCRVCGLIFSSPRPEPVEVEQSYGVDPLNYFSEKQASHKSHLPSKTFKELRSLLSQFEEPLLALDIGTGTGRNLLDLEVNGFLVTGVEASTTFYQQALINTRDIEVNLIHDTIENVEFARESFHLVVMSAVLEHFYEPDKVLEKVSTILKPGGIVFIEVPNSEWILGRLLNFYHKVIFSRLVTNLSPMHKPFHLYEFSLKSFQCYLQRTGNFTVEKYEYLSGELSQLGRIQNRLLRPLLSLSRNGVDLLIVLRK